jgi:hypothetical protein
LSLFLSQSFQGLAETKSFLDFCIEVYGLGAIAANSISGFEQGEYRISVG